MNAVPAAQHLRRNAEVLRNALDRISGMNFVAGDATRVRRRITRRMFPGRDRDHDLASASSSLPSRWLADEIDLAVV